MNIKTAVAGTVLAVAALLAAGCSNQLNDLKGVGQSHPDYIMTYLNVSGSPNITLMCIHGVGFATTTRSLDALTLVPQWNSFCAEHEGR